MAIKHGGNLIQIAEQYNSDPEEWIDLSTGVSPFTYPVGDIPASAWNQLPQANDGLEAAAQQYYQAPVEPVAVGGSQAAIMAMPSVITEKLERCGTVALPRVGYKEHQHAWTSYQKDGQCWKVEYYEDFPSLEQISVSDVVLLINPNNPTGRFTSKEDLTDVAVALSAKGGYLIVDEAFVDCTPEISMLNRKFGMGNLIVLRSVGKFFGLAGARVGFVFAEQQIKRLLEEYLGPWTVSGPGRWAMKAALMDTDWHKETSERIKAGSARLNQLLGKHLKARRTGTDLFTTVYLENAPECHEHLCRLHVLTRLCDEKNALRFGLPANESQWQQLESVLTALALLAEYQKESICE